MSVFDSEFKRKFSLSMYKNLKISMGEMSFYKDFINDNRGNLYPVINKSDDCVEKIECNTYIIRNGFSKRLFCQFFPYATYEITACVTDGKAGFSFITPECEAQILVSGKTMTYFCKETAEKVDLPEYIDKKITLIVSCRPICFDVYFKIDGSIEFFHTFSDDNFKKSNKYTAFSNSYVALFAAGDVTVEKVESYIDNGISIADIRPIRYENSEVMAEQGRVYLTATVRMQSEFFQGIFSWIPGTAEFDMTGALFYDCGDGFWCGDVAASVLYHCEEKRWYLWVCSFSHGHILGHSVFDGDIRYGVNVVDITLMEKAPNGADISLFAGFENDEDPDFFFDEANNRWLMSICRINPETKNYSYVFFESEKPFGEYKYIGKGPDGCETGGSFVKVNDELYFVCGNDFFKTSDYRVYSKAGVVNAHFNYPDGGFRGWGTVIPIKMGSRTRYFWLTFDRHNGSDYNWSYGNLYCFEAERKRDE